MKRNLSILFLAMFFLVSACNKKNPDNFIAVKGGTFKNEKSNYTDAKVKISDFYLGKYEVTQKEWVDVMGSNPSAFKGDNFPVDTVSWYDCIEYCNKRSETEGLKPYYNIDKKNKDPENNNEYDDIKWTVTINEGANGYRLPTEQEWEYAATGGMSSKNYEFSGSNNIKDVGWDWTNAGDKILSGDWTWPAVQNNNNKTKEIGKKKPNELGFYDMSGNVREWCWEWYQDPQVSDGTLRVWKGGGWLGDTRACANSYRGKFDPNGKGSDQGLRLCRNK